MQFYTGVRTHELSALVLDTHTHTLTYKASPAEFQEEARQAQKK